MTESAAAPVPDHESPRASPRDALPLREATRTWFLISLQTFGGPAGQIAVMQRTLVDEKRWIGQGRFLHALNYCMLLPGAEAQQLAIYIGWLLNGLRGGTDRRHVVRAAWSACPPGSFGRVRRLRRHDRGRRALSRAGAGGDRDRGPGGGARESPRADRAGPRRAGSCSLRGPRVLRDPVPVGDLAAGSLGWLLVRSAPPGRSRSHSPRTTGPPRSLPTTTCTKRCRPLDGGSASSSSDSSCG